MSGLAPSPPKAWKYGLSALLMLLLLVPAWTLFVMLVIQPEMLMDNPSVIRQLIWWVGVPVLTVSAFLGWRFHVVSQQASHASIVGVAALSTPTDHGPVDEQARREYVLEIIGLGVTLDKYRQGALWDVLRNGHPYATVREQDPMKYPWSGIDKDGVEGSRVNDALESGAKRAPIYWGQPAFYADAVDDPDHSSSPTDGPSVIGDPSGSGMLANLFVAAGWQISERPDRLLERVFAFFDEHQDVPYVVLSANDGFFFRDLYRPKGSPKLVRDGYYVPEMPDSAALFLLARRERVDAIRPFIFKDADADKNMLADEANKKGYARRMFLTFLEAQKTGTVTVPKWLQATKAFAQRPDIYPKGFSMLFDDMLTDRHPPRDYKPTPWFPIPWAADQLEDFDNLPTLGFLHRPIFVKTVDAHGQPLARRDARAAALAAGWNEALQTLPEADRKASPARVVFSTGAQSHASTEQKIALTTALDGWTQQGGPELDKSDASRWIDTDARLGNTGAATWFMQMAIGAMGSYRDGGTSAAINLRDPREASIVLVTPPTEAQRRHNRGDVLRFEATPAIDPGNYGQR